MLWHVALEVVGWAGAGIVLLGYVAFSLGWIPNGKRYQTANFVGATLATIYVFAKSAWPSVFVNLVWGAVALAVLVRMLAGAYARRRTEQALASHTLEEAVPILAQPINLVETMTSSIPIVAVPGPVPVTPNVEGHLLEAIEHIEKTPTSEITVQDAWEHSAEIDQLIEHYEQEIEEARDHYVHEVGEVHDQYQHDVDEVRDQFEHEVESLRAQAEEQLQRIAGDGSGE